MGWHISGRFDSHGQHLLAPIAPGPDGVRASVCPVCRESVAVSAGGGWVRLRCGACGTEFIATDGTGPPPAPPADAAEPAPKPERVYFDEEGVLVTDARFAAPGCAFAMSDVLWCTVRAVPGRWRWPWVGVLMLWGALGLAWVAGAAVALAFASGVPGFVRGLAAAVAAGLLALGGLVFREARRHRYRRLDRYQVVCGVGGLEVVAFSDADEELVRRVAAAVSEAMFSAPA